MAVLQGIEVTIVQRNSRRDTGVQVPFEEKPISRIQKCSQGSAKDQQKQTSCFILVKDGQYFTVCLKVVNGAEWFNKIPDADTLRVQISIDGGSLIQIELLPKTDLSSKRTKVIDRFGYRDDGTGKHHISCVAFEKRQISVYDIGFLAEPGPKDGDIVVKLSQGKTKRLREGKPSPCVPEKDVSKRPSKSLSAAGVTLFAAPDLEQAVLVKNKYSHTQFTRRKEVEEIQFSFKYRAEECLFENASGGYLSKSSGKDSSSKLDYGPKRSSNRPAMLRTMQAEQTATPPPSPQHHSITSSIRSKRARIQEQAEVEQPGLLSEEELAAKKAAWLEQDDDDECIDRETVKKMKREHSSAIKENLLNDVVDLEAELTGHECEPREMSHAQLVRELRRIAILDEIERRAKLE